jgi:hypothetical protein
VFSSFLRKYKNLKIALSEGGTGWVPYFLERADYVYAHHRHWTHQDFGKKTPSDVFREHIITCFIDDPVGVRTRDLTGIDGITWECDYPHSDATWPESPERLWSQIQGIPDADLNKITHLNAMKHFQYDPFKQIEKKDATVAALRAKAKHVDVTPRRGSGGTTPSNYEKGFVTVADIMKQMSTAFATPFAGSQEKVVDPITAARKGQP